MSGLAMDLGAGVHGITEGLMFLGNSSGKTDEEIYEIKKDIIDKYISIKFFYYNMIIFNNQHFGEMKQFEQIRIRDLMDSCYEDYGRVFIKYLRQEKLYWIDIVFNVFKRIYDKVKAVDNWERIDRKDDEYIKKITPSMMRRKIGSHLIPPPAFDVIKEGWEFFNKKKRKAVVKIGDWKAKTVVVPEVDHLGNPIKEGNKFRIPHKPKDGPKTDIEQLLKMIEVRNQTDWETQTEKTYKKKSSTEVVSPWISLWPGRTTALGDYGMYNNLRNINEYKWIFEELCRTYSWKRDKEIVQWLNVKIRNDPELRSGRKFLPSLERFEQGGDLAGRDQDSIYTLNSSGVDGLTWVFPDGSLVEESDSTTGETKGIQMGKMPSREVGVVDKINIDINQYATNLLDLRDKKIAEQTAYRAARGGDENKFNFHKKKHDEYKEEIKRIKSNLKEMDLWGKVEALAVKLNEKRGGRRKVRKTSRVGTRRFRKSLFRKSLFKKKMRSLPRTKRKRRKKRTKRRKKRTKKGHRSASPQRKTRRIIKN